MADSIDANLASEIRGFERENNNINDRNFTYEQKVFYQYQDLEYLRQQNAILWFTYYISTLILIYFIVVYWATTPMIKALVIIALLIYPYAIYTIEYYAYDLGNYIYSLITANIYSSVYKNDY